MKAFEKINEEMQKSPDDGYMEILGHYLIDRCADLGGGALIGVEGKTLKGAMDAVMDEAKKKKHGTVAVLSDAEVFGIVDEYFGLKTDYKAQYGALPKSEKKPVASAGTVLDLSDFL